MRWSISVGRVLGFPVELHLTLLLVFGLVLLLGGGWLGVALLALAFGSVLAHELGHAVVARRCKVPMLGITLYPFGGIARMAGPPRTPGDEIRIAIAGPAVSLALAAAGWLVWVAVGHPLVFQLALVNTILGLFNLVPALPMDGGRVLRAALALRTGNLKATRIATWAARGFAVVFAALAFWVTPMLLFIAGLVWFMSGQELRAVEASEAEARRPHTLDPDLARLLAELAAKSRVAQRVTAFTAAQTVLDVRPEPGPQLRPAPARAPANAPAPVRREGPPGLGGGRPAEI